jgi:hypothetical protein
MAIVIERTITIKNDKATLDNPIYLYTGDGDITFLFTIKEVKKSARFGSINTTNLVTDNASYGEIRIYKPTDELVFTTRAEIIDDKLQALFTYEHIDQLTEAGIHQLQIHLYDESYGERNRFTIPPVDLNILFPVGTTISRADYAFVDYAVLKVSEEPLDVFNEDGSYIKTEWIKGDIISSGKLNKIEDAIYEISDNYATETYINSAITNLNINDYATKTYVNSTITNLNIDDYATKNEVSQSLNNYIQKSEISEIDDLVFSNSITRIEIVTEYPEIEEPGVLYIKVRE